MFLLVYKVYYEVHYEINVQITVEYITAKHAFFNAKTSLPVDSRDAGKLIIDIQVSVSHFHAHKKKCKLVNQCFFVQELCKPKRDAVTL